MALIDFGMKVNMLTLVLNDLASVCCLTRPPKLSGLKKMKTQRFVISHDDWVGQVVLGLVSLGLTCLLCLTGKVIVLEGPGGFPHCMAFSPCCPKVVLVLVNTFSSPGFLTRWSQGSISQLWSSVEARSLEAHAVAVTQCHLLHTPLVKATHKPSPFPCHQSKFKGWKNRHHLLMGFAKCSSLLFPLSPCTLQSNTKLFSVP